MKLKLLTLLFIMFTNIVLANTLNLTKEEKNWLKDNPMVKVTVMNYWNHDGDGNTIHTDYLKLLNRYSSLNIIPIRYDTWTDGYSQVVNSKDNNIHGIMNLSWSKEREEKYFLYTKAYNFEPNYLVVRKLNNDISNLQELKTKTVLVKAKSITIDIVKEISDKINIIEVKSDLDMYKQLFENKNIDAFVTYNKNKELLDKYNLKVAKTIYDKFSEVSIGISKQYPHLQSIINKAYKAIPKDELSNLQNKIYSYIKPYKNKSILKSKYIFTDEEQDYIKQKQSVTIAMLNNFKPFSFIEYDKHQGLSVDILEKISELSGLKFNKKTLSWSKALDSFKEKNVDMISGISHTQAREEFTIFSEPFYEIPTYIFGLKDDVKYKHIKDLKGKRVGVNKNMFYIDTLKKLGIKVKQYEGSNQKVKALAFGEIDYFLANYTTGLKAIKFQLATNIKAIDEYTGIKREDLRYGINKENKILHSIIKKSLKQIKSNELEQLINKWILGLEKLSPILINLTTQEKEFIKNNTLKVGVEQWKPAIYSNNGTDIDGVAGDFLKEVINLTGLKVEIVSDRWPNILSGLENKIIDMIPATYYTKNREKFGLYGDGFFKMKDFIYMRESDNSINSLKDLEGKILAITEGNGRIDDIKQHFPKIKFAFTKDYNEAINLLLNHQVDAIYDSQITMNNMIRENMIIGIKGIAQKTFKTPSLHFFSRIDKPILQSILQKGLNAISKQKRDEIKNKWLGLSEVKNDEIKLDLILQEKKYLKNKKVIKMCIDPNWMPFEKIENKKHIGLSSNYIKLISQSINTPIELVQTTSWVHSLEKAKERECDILSLASNTKSRREYMDFTSAYITAPIVIATKVGIPFIDNLESIIKQKLGVVKGYSLHETLRKEYPNINLVEVKSIDDGLDKVESGRIFGYLDNSIVLNYEIQKNYISTISVSGKFIHQLKLNIATRNDEPILNNILQKAIDSIDYSTKQNILNKWVDVSYASKTDYILIWKILLVVFIVGVFILYRQYILKKLNKKLEEKQHKLEDSLSDFEYLFNNTIETIALFQNNICIDINEAGLKLLKYQDKSELVGKNALSFVHPDDVEIAKANMINQSIEPYEIRVLKKDGTSFPTYLKGDNTTIKGKVTRITAIVDLTELKQKEYELIKEKEKAQLSNQAKSQFLANMSHEIRTPINGIIGMTYLLKETTLTDKQKKYSNTIETSSNNLLNIINDILDFSKIEAGKLNIEKIDFNLNELIANISSIVSFRAIEKDIEFDIFYDKDIENCLFGDSLRISQILMNLISNSIKFTEKGFVKVYISHTPTDIFKFEIIDTGIGIGKKEQKKLFQSFSQADASTTRKYGGTGLGLSISKQLVELMDGTIYFESELGKGSKFTFEIRLPKGDENNIAHIKQIDTTQITTLKGSNILLVEDNITNQEIVKGLLEHSGINIDIANNGQEAIEMFENNTTEYKDYELIFMDLQMPVMGGIKATEIIRGTQKGKDIPIIALTANAMREDIYKTKQAKMNDHLIKPINIEKLYETLLKYISKKVDVTTKSLDKQDDIKIPNFINLDMKIGLSYMNNNKELFLTILNDFKIRYMDFDFDNLNNEEFKLATHTMQGLSANIGAIRLNEIAKKLDKTQDKSLLPRVYNELKLLIDELTNLLVDEKSSIKLKIISDEKRVELFTQLKKALISKRPKQYQPIVEEFKKYELNENDAKLFTKVKTFVKEYKIDSAIDLIKGIK